jgi:ubiquitin carboxyl-terminal hydrolase 25/28
VRDGDLYTAWEAYTKSVVEYSTNRSVNVSAEKHIWLRSVPESLMFQIQRVTYESKQPLKLNSEFKFDRVIYADRFLEENKDIFITN